MLSDLLKQWSILTLGTSSGGLGGVTRTGVGANDIRVGTRICVRWRGLWGGGSSNDSFICRLIVPERFWQVFLGSVGCGYADSC